MQELLLGLYADYPADACGSAALARKSTLKALHASTCAPRIMRVGLFLVQLSSPECQAPAKDIGLPRVNMSSCRLHLAK